MTCRAAGAILRALYPRPGVRLPFGDSYRRASQYPPLFAALEFGLRTSVGDEFAVAALAAGALAFVLLRRLH